MTTITIERALLKEVVDIFDNAISTRYPHEILRDIRTALAAPATAPATAPEPSTDAAVKTLCKALREDLDYAWSWHCNIAMTAFDAGCPHDVANEGAARLLQLLAGVDTRNHPGFQDTQDNPMRNDKAAPAWHDAPNAPGDWVIVGKGFKSELQTGISQQEIDRVSSWPGRWYGPIPEDKP